MSNTNAATTPTERILVTGASRGIGRAIAVALATDATRHIVAHCVNDLAGAEQTCAEVSARGALASCLQFDISDREQTRAVLELELQTNGAFYGVVLNAGVTADSIFPALTGEAWDKVIHTNLDGFYNVLAPLVMPMIRRRKPGRIVSISSASGQIGNRGQSNYSASKAGIIGATKALALELASRKITVNCIAPGLINTDMTEDLPMEDMLKAIPMQRAGEPDEVANAVKFLMSAEASYITKQVIAVNGGLC